MLHRPGVIQTNLKSLKSYVKLDMRFMIFVIRNLGIPGLHGRKSIAIGLTGIRRHLQNY